MFLPKRARERGVRERKERECERESKRERDGEGGEIRKG